MEKCRIILREMEVSDDERVTFWIGQPGMAIELSWKYPVTLEGTRQFFEAAIKNKSCRLFIIEEKGGLPLGFTMLYGIDLSLREARTGTLIGEENRNKGYAKESRQLLFDIAFGTLGIERLLSRTRRDNLAARSFLESASYTLVTNSEDADHDQDHYHFEVHPPAS